VLREAARDFYSHEILLLLPAGSYEVSHSAEWDQLPRFCRASLPVASLLPRWSLPFPSLFSVDFARSAAMFARSIHETVAAA